jgi:hypothetical protein
MDGLISDYRSLTAELELVITHAQTCITHAENRESARVGALVSVIERIDRRSLDESAYPQVWT